MKLVTKMELKFHFCFVGKIPDQFQALKLMAPSNAVAGVQPSQNWPSTVINQVSKFSELSAKEKVTCTHEVTSTYNSLGHTFFIC